MLNRLRNFLTRNRAYPVESFGKLPCYQDYISVVTTPEGMQWRDWLLAEFANGDMVPGEIRPFVYQHRKNADPVIGLVEGSSDGRREFPFSVFVVFSGGSRQKGGIFKAAVMEIWREIEPIRSRMTGATTINDCYAGVYGRKIRIAKDRLRPIAEDNHGFHCPPQERWPRMLVAVMEAGELYLVGTDRFKTSESGKNVGPAE